ncbi:MAG TPA: hypothetical protein VFH99_01240 [Candidatus Saccharimonadales bacterium]|nr:hypothetical protein [Candidatus Saccharimonadales bacterium]
MAHETPPESSPFERIRLVVPNRIDRGRYYGIIAVAMFKSSALDVVHGMRYALGLGDEYLRRDYHKRHMHGADARLFDFAIKNDTLRLHPESLLDDDWRSTVED